MLCYCKHLKSSLGAYEESIEYFFGGGHAETKGKHVFSFLRVMSNYFPEWLCQFILPPAK